MKKFAKIFTVYSEDVVTTHIDLSIPVYITVFLLLLKLTGYTSMGWWLVTAPVWVAIVIGIVVTITFTFAKMLIKNEKSNNN